MFTPTTSLRKEDLGEYEVRLVLGIMTTAYSTETPPPNTYQITVEDKQTGKTKTTFMSLDHYKEEHYQHAVENLITEIKNGK